MVIVHCIPVFCQIDLLKGWFSRFFKVRKIDDKFLKNRIVTPDSPWGVGELTTLRLAKWRRR
jgi:hypothetical protein